MSRWNNMAKSKYGSVKCEVDGIKFPSLKEARYYAGLLLRVKSDDDPLVYFLRQVSFDLPGGTRYRVDFMEVYPDHIEYVDVKGFETKDFKRNKKQVEAIYPVEILVK